MDPPGRTFLLCPEFRRLGWRVYMRCGRTARDIRVCPCDGAQVRCGGRALCDQKQKQTRFRTGVQFTQSMTMSMRLAADPATWPMADSPRETD
eukprot:124711-Prymnesium_polylepis.2